MRRLIPLLALWFVVGCAGDGRTPLVIYSPHGRDLLTLVEEQFEAANPDVDVRWLDMGSQEVYDRIRSEAANPQADVWFGGPAAMFGRAAEAGFLEAHRPAWADAIPAHYQGADDLYFGLYRTPPILVYNEDAIAPEDAPQDWDDLLDPKWDDTILVREPLVSGTMRTIFGMIIARSIADTGSPDAGFEWLLELDAQTKEYVHNPSLMHQKLSRQEGMVALWELTDILFQRLRGNPLGYTFPTSGSPVIVDSIAVVANSDQSELAKRFVDWVGSREIQELTAQEAFRLPARTDLPADELPEWARDALDKLVEAEVDWALIEAEGKEWMNRWDRDVRNKGEE